MPYKTPEHQAMRAAMQLHNPPAHPHWSTRVEWRHDRWDPMINAPVAGYPILHIRGRTANGTIFEPVHRAYGDGDGMMSPFDGWFAAYPNKNAGFYEVLVVEWQPLRATYGAIA